MKILIMLMLVVHLISATCNKETYIPDKAKSLFIDIIISNEDVIPDKFTPWYFSALIEHESCVRLCGNNYWARRCWSPKSKLATYWDKEKTRPREEGAGLLQLTRAWRKNGSLRLDTITNLKRRYPKQLSELTWNNVYSKPNLQIKAGMLLWRDNDRYLNSNITGYNRLWFLDSIYNGGSKYLLRERTKCKLMKDCDPLIWFDNVADVNARGNRILYGKRSAWMINRDHVKDVKFRMIKYKLHYLDFSIYKLEDDRLIKIEE